MRFDTSSSMNKQSNMIFTADDFGISDTADERILKLAEAGILDRVAVMTRGTATKESLDRLARSGVKIDLHAEIRDDIDPNRTLTAGAFGRILVFAKNFLFGENRAFRVADRWDTQIRDFHSIFGKYPDGLNSHEHTHFFPPYFRHLLRLAKQYNIAFIRFGRESFPGNAAVSHILNMLRLADRRAFVRSGIASSDMMVSFDWIGSLDVLERYPKDKTIEILFHPERDEEMEFLEKNYLLNSEQ